MEELDERFLIDGVVIVDNIGVCGDDQVGIVGGVPGVALERHKRSIAIDAELRAISLAGLCLDH